MEGKSKVAAEAYSEDVELKTAAEVESIRRAAYVVTLVLAHVRQSISPGRTTAQVERECAQLLARHNAISSQESTGGFPATVCISVNSVAAHGIPGEYLLENGDILTVDVTACIEGWYADGAWTYLVGEGDEDARRLLSAAWQCCRSGVRAARAGARLGDVGAAIQSTAGRLGCVVLGEFAGHGIGRRIHEPPTVHHVAERATGMPIVPGLVFTIEPIVTFGAADTNLLADGWTYVTADGARTAQFEHTIAVFGRRTENLTLPDGNRYVDFPPFF